MKRKICVIGLGTLGSYLVKRVVEQHGDATEITVVEIGDSTIKNEQEIGLDSISKNSFVAKEGRYFGFGGTSARWGGQVLFFDERDNFAGDETWNEIIRQNNTYRDRVISKLLGENKKLDFEDNNQNIKTGIWLKYNKRNTYKSLSKTQLQQINIMPNMRVVDFDLEESNITKVVCKTKSGRIVEVEADQFYLTAGALESCRLLLALSEKTGVLNHTDLGKNFGDHISTELFHIKNSPPVLNGVDFTPIIHKGNLITKRMIVQTEDGLVGFLHCVYNKDVKAFKFIKELLFGKRETTVTTIEFLRDVVFLFKFTYHLLFKKSLYVNKSQWSLQLDMEQAVPNENELVLTAKKDQFEESVLKINWEISTEDEAAIKEMREKIEEMLNNNNLQYSCVYNPLSTNNKVEDVYHPVGCMRVGSDDKAVVGFDGKVKNIDNLFHFSTGVFPSAKSINPTASVCCLIENHLEALNEN